MQVYLKGVAVAACLACSTWAQADTITIDFEGLTDFETIDTQYQASDVVFNGATALISGALGGSLNELDYPPHSGDTVASQLSGPMVIDFLRPVVRVAGFFTYTGGYLTLSGQDGTGDVASATSTGIGNLASSAGSPNERIELVFASGLSRLVIGDGFVDFTLDDLEVEFADAVVNPMPEPSLTLLAGVALVAAARARRRT